MTVIRQHNSAGSAAAAATAAAAAAAAGSLGPTSINKEQNMLEHLTCVGGQAC